MKKVIYRNAQNRLTEASVYEITDFVSVYSTTSFSRPVLTALSGMIDQSLIPAVPSSALQITKIANQNISKGDCVYSTNADRVGIASFNLTRSEALVQGIAMADALANQPVTFAVIGILVMDIFKVFTVNDVLYLDSLGGLTNERPSDGYLVPVAKALGSGAIMVQIGYPSKVGGV